MNQTTTKNSAAKYIKIGTRYERMMAKDICYVKAQDDHMEIVFKDTHTLISRITMKTLLAQLPADQFVRVHRSYLVALDSITAFTSTKVQVAGIELPIGRLYKKDLKQFLMHRELVNH